MRLNPIKSAHVGISSRVDAVSLSVPQALAAWFYARKDDLQEAFGAPAVTVFGRTFDFRSMLKSSPVRLVPMPRELGLYSRASIQKLSLVAHRGCTGCWAALIVATLKQVDFRRVLDLSVWPSSGSDNDNLETASSSGRRQRDADGAESDGSSQPLRQHPAAEALRRGGHSALGFGFSAGGLLFPYYIGVLYGLHDLGVITCAQLSCRDSPE